MVACNGSVYFRIDVPSFMFNEKLDVVNECIKELISHSYNSPSISKTNSNVEKQYESNEMYYLYTIGGSYVGIYDFSTIKQSMHGVFLIFHTSPKEDSHVEPELLIL